LVVGFAGLVLRRIPAFGGGLGVHAVVRCEGGGRGAEAKKNRRGVTRRFLGDSWRLSCVYAFASPPPVRCENQKKAK
jgi:hypothetical protein